MDLSITIPTLNENNNIMRLIPRVMQVIATINCRYEIIVVDGGSIDGTPETAQHLGAIVIHQTERGYGGALKEGFKAARGECILTLDADFSHDPHFIQALWERRDTADVIIASRYVESGSASMPFLRKLLSIILNTIFSKTLSLPLKDISSGFRLYKKRVLDALNLESRDFEILEEILIKCYAEGYTIVEVPFAYAQRDTGTSKARVIKFGYAIMKTFFRMWRLRNSIDCADYDERAYYSRIPLQRYWQHRRHDFITENALLSGLTLDIGCGSSVILQTIKNAIGLDIRLNKLRYMTRHHKPLIQGTIWSLPFKDRSFSCVICSQVIEHLEPGAAPCDEIARVLRSGGRLIIGTPDYGGIMWNIIEPLYGFFKRGGYKSEHITCYTRESLLAMLHDRGFVLEKECYILKAEMILVLRKED
ncbi:MAG: glycosyltransferase [Proteobacteria bacterium]|nr:glycosyltransferase [Pseudomonadota bacterium]